MTSRKRVSRLGSRVSDPESFLAPDTPHPAPEARPRRIRAFLAVDLDPVVHAGLVRLKHELAAIAPNVRWVGDAGLHATLKFLGAVEPAQLDAVRDALLPQLERFPCFTAGAGGLGVFPSLRRPRVVWIGLDGAGFTDMARLIENALAPLGFSAERRPFRAHVTLARIEAPRGWTQLEDAARAHWNDHFGPSIINSLIAYRSDLRPGGAVYTRLWTIALEDTRGGVAHGTGR